MLLVKKIIRFTPILIIYFLVIFFGDAANVFFHDYEENAVNHILNGFNVSNIGNYNERKFQEIYIQNNNSNLDVIVLGSSRSMQIGNELFGSKSFFNHSVSGASLEDYLAILNKYSTKNLPSKIILGVDPWIFNQNNSQDRWKTLESDYNDFLDILEINNSNKFSIDVSFFNLISISYFQSSLRDLINIIFNPTIKKELTPTNALITDTNIKLTDGSLNYSIERILVSDETLNDYVNSYTRDRIYSMNRYFKLNSFYIEVFEKTIDYLQKSGVEVVIFLPPYEQRVYDFMISEDDYNIIQDVETYLSNFSFENSINLIGSYNPNNIEINSQETNLFYDAMHPSREFVYEIFKNALD